MNNTVQRWSSRKFWLMVFSWLIYVWLLTAGHIGEAIFQTLTFLNIGGYLVGNIYAATHKGGSKT